MRSRMGRRPSQRSGRGRAAFRRSGIGTGGPPGGLGEIGRPSGGTVGVGRASRLSSRGRKALPALAGIGRPSRRSGWSFWRSGRGR